MNEKTDNNAITIFETPSLIRTFLQLNIKIHCNGRI